MKVAEIIKRLKKHGCYVTNHGARHDEWYSPVTRKYFMVPRHRSKELPTGTAESIRKAAGI